jgi:hypothetical protein
MLVSAALAISRVTYGAALRWLGRTEAARKKLTRGCDRESRGQSLGWNSHSQGGLWLGPRPWLRKELNGRTELDAKRSSAIALADTHVSCCI